jgi:hypothetical protein
MQGLGAIDPGTPVRSRRVSKLSLSGDPPNNLAAASLIRAATADNPDSGILIMSEHDEAEASVLAVRWTRKITARSARAVDARYACAG